ncbi:MAG: hypothetical protein BRC29_01950 [Nanohaloarchaea archaeon SW_7_43_1]|nr:MAG: hypothetical protein BRC29_01950 [Nanohaloarchaea archaeon SW_7_43_1]
MSKSDEAESEISKAESNVEKSGSLEREISEFGKQAKDTHKNYAERRKKEKSGVERVEEEFGTALDDENDREFREVAKDIGDLEAAEKQDLAEIGEELKSEEKIESEIQNLIEHSIGSEEHLGRAAMDLGEDLSQMENLLNKDPGRIGKRELNQFERDVKDIDKAAEVQQNSIEEMENIINDLATLEKEDNELERLEKNLQAQSKMEGGLIQNIEKSGEKLHDKELIKKGQKEAMKLQKLNNKLKKDERITEDVEKKLSKEIEEMQDDLLKAENVEKVLKNRENQLARISKEAKADESKTDPQTKKILERMVQDSRREASRLDNEINEEESELSKEEDQISRLKSGLRSNNKSSTNYVAYAAAIVTGIIIIIFVL